MSFGFGRKARGFFKELLLAALPPERHGFVGCRLRLAGARREHDDRSTAVVTHPRAGPGSRPVLGIAALDAVTHPRSLARCLPRLLAVLARSPRFPCHRLRCSSASRYRVRLDSPGTLVLAFTRRRGLGVRPGTRRVSPPASPSAFNSFLSAATSTFSSAIRASARLSTAAERSSARGRCPGLGSLLDPGIPFLGSLLCCGDVPPEHETAGPDAAQRDSRPDSGPVSLAGFSGFLTVPLPVPGSGRRFGVVEPGDESSHYDAVDFRAVVCPPTACGRRRRR